MCFETKCWAFAHCADFLVQISYFQSGGVSESNGVSAAKKSRLDQEPLSSSSGNSSGNSSSTPSANQSVENQQQRPSANFRPWSNSEDVAAAAAAAAAAVAASAETARRGHYYQSKNVNFRSCLDGGKCI